VTVTVADLIQKLQELPPDWHINATKSGSSLEFHEPVEDWWKPGHPYGLVFTDDRPNRHMQRR
jgi:hypothetical protein